MKIKIAVITILALSLAIQGCAGQSPINSTLEITPPNSVLAGTDWQLVSFQSMDDSVGIIMA